MSQGGAGGAGDAGGQMSNLTGILNWSLKHSDGTKPARQVTEEDRKFFFEAMAAATIDPIERMKAITAELTSADACTALSDAQLEYRVALLEELQDHVEDIDAACDLSKIGGLPPLLAQLRSPHAPVRALAAEVLATSAQNNPKAQQQLLDGGVMAPLLRLAREDADDTARLKALLALGCMVRHFPPAEAAFKLGDGFGALKAAASAEDARLQRKAFQLARNLLTCDGNLTTLVELGFIRAGSAALAAPDRGLREAALGLLLDVARAVDFEALPSAVDDFRAPSLAARLDALRAALDGLAGDEERAAAADERALADALHAMLAPQGAH